MTDPVTPADILGFWTEAGPQMWYAKVDAFDQRIRDRFGALWHSAHDGALPDWQGGAAEDALALVILLDQFPRNMFRDDPRAYATDAQALAVSEGMIAAGQDLAISEPMRQFVYMPFMHSEALADQDRCIDLMESRMSSGDNALHARVHREIIAQFGRFPYRNAPLGRAMTPQEQTFLDTGGYGQILQKLQGDPA